MKVSIIDHQPIFIMGLERYLQYLFNCDAEIETCQSAIYVNDKFLKTSDMVLINLELYTYVLNGLVEKTKSTKAAFKLIGLVDVENLDILLHAKLINFDSLLIRSTLMDELKIMLSFIKQNRKYYSPEIIEYLNDQKDININQLNYERN